jgi:uncharacterized protein YaeQ
LRSDTARGDGKIVLESRASESDRHIALKILAYLLFKDETGGAPLRIEQGVGQRHKPDLVATDEETGRVLLWIDCGQIEGKRLGRIVEKNPGARIVVVKATGNEATLYARAVARFLPERSAAIVTFVGFDDGFLPEFLSRLRGRNDIALARNGDDLEIVMNGERLMTRLQRL